MLSMDERDYKIISNIADLGTGNIDELHKETKIPPSTIHYRIDKLKKDGIFTNDLFDLNIYKAGFKITIVSEVDVDFRKGHQDDVGNSLSQIEGVTQVYFTMGETDFVVIAHLPDQESIERLVDDYKSIEEVNRTNSKYVVKNYKQTMNPISSYDLDTILNSELVE